MPSSLPVGSVEHVTQAMAQDAGTGAVQEVSCALLAIAYQQGYDRERAHATEPGTKGLPELLCIKLARKEQTLIFAGLLLVKSELLGFHYDFY